MIDLLQFNKSLFPISSPDVFTAMSQIVSKFSSVGYPVEEHVMVCFGKSRIERGFVDAMLKVTITFTVVRDNGDRTMYEWRCHRAIDFSCHNHEIVELPL